MNILCFQPNKCYNADEILAIYNARNTDTLTKKNFLELCPSLIYQQVSKACAPLPQQGSKPKHALASSEGPNISLSFEKSSFCIFLYFACILAWISILFFFNLFICIRLTQFSFTLYSIRIRDPGRLHSVPLLHSGHTLYSVCQHRLSEDIRLRVGSVSWPGRWNTDRRFYSPSVPGSKLDF